LRATLDVPTLKMVPPLTPGFVPLAMMKAGYDEAVAKAGGKSLVLGFQRGDEIRRVETRVFPCGHILSGWNWVLFRDLVRSGLAFYGADTVWVGAGDENVGRELVRVGQFLYPDNDQEAKVAFSAGFFRLVYGRPLEFKSALPYEVPATSERWYPITGDADGCVLSMDYGKGNVRAGAFVDGELVGELVDVTWEPAKQANLAYLLEKSLEAAQKAEAYLPEGQKFERMRISTAGIVSGNRILIGSILRDVPKGHFDEASRLFLRTADGLGINDVVVVNDGTAASASLGYVDCLGAAFGSDEATGYYGGAGITSQLVEGAFVPIECVDLSRAGGLFLYDWARARGLGGEDFSQKGPAGHYARLAGLTLEGENLPERLVHLQSLHEAADERALQICMTFAYRLASAIAWYKVFYPDMKHVVTMGRVMRGSFGQTALSETQRALAVDYPAVASEVEVHLAEEPEFQQLKTMARIVRS